MAKNRHDAPHAAPSHIFQCSRNGKEMSITHRPPMLSLSENRRYHAVTGSPVQHKPKISVKNLRS